MYFSIFYYFILSVFLSVCMSIVSVFMGHVARFKLNENDDDDDNNNNNNNKSACIPNNNGTVTKTKMLVPRTLYSNQLPDILIDAETNFVLSHHFMKKGVIIQVQQTQCITKLTFKVTAG